jgi:hypothetical protein
VAGVTVAAVAAAAASTVVGVTTATREAVVGIAEVMVCLHII